MSKAIRSSTNPRQAIRLRKKFRIRKKIALHNGEIARLVVYRSNRFLYAQVIDDLKAHTIAWADTSEEGVVPAGTSPKNIAAGKILGKLIGQRALEKKVDRVLFDRNGYDYHGRIKAVADAAREAGLKF